MNNTCEPGMEVVNRLAQVSVLFIGCVQTTGFGPVAISLPTLSTKLNILVSYYVFVVVMCCGYI